MWFQWEGETQINSHMPQPLLGLQKKKRLDWFAALVSSKKEISSFWVPKSFLRSIKCFENLFNHF